MTGMRALWGIVPNSNGLLVANDFPGKDIGERFNNAVIAAKAMRDATANTWLPDVNGILIMPGAYALATPLVVSECPNILISAYGVTLQNFSGAYHALKVVSSAFVMLHGLQLNFRNNNVAPEALLIAGGSPYFRSSDLWVQANSSLPDFAAVRLKQGNSGGFDDDNQTLGNFWAVFDRFWCNKLDSNDANGIAMGLDLQGCQNAFQLLNSTLANCNRGVLIKNQNGSGVSGVSGDVQISHTKFETIADHAVKYFTTDGTDAIAGGCVSFCRAEGVGTFVGSEGFAAASQPVMLMGNTISGSGIVHIDAASRRDFNSLDASIAPASAHVRIFSNKGAFFGSTSGSGSPSIRALAKQRADGGAVALEREDGTIDGRISQIPGGGMELDGGQTYRLRAKHLLGLSGTDIHANNLRGSAPNPVSGTTKTISFPVAEPDANYFIDVHGDTNRKYWVTNRTAAGFTINTEPAFNNDGTMWWHLIR